MNNEIIVVLFIVFISMTGDIDIENTSDEKIEIQQRILDNDEI